MSAYLSAVLADAPVHYWRMADPGGALCHDIGSAPFHAHGGGGTSQLGYSGPVSDGGSFDFAATGDRANTGEVITVALNLLTLELWLWQFQNIGGFGPYLQPRYPTNVGLLRNGAQWQFTYNNVNALSNANYTSHAWHHLVGTYDGANARLYVDGILRNTVAVGVEANAAEICQISTRSPLDVWGQAFLSEVAIYNSALSAARVLAHFNAADQVNQSPIFGAAQLGSGGAGGADFAGTLQLILQSVRKVY